MNISKWRKLYGPNVKRTYWVPEGVESLIKTVAAAQDSTATDVLIEAFLDKHDPTWRQRMRQPSDGP